MSQNSFSEVLVPNIPLERNDSNLFSILYDFTRVSLMDCEYIGSLEMKQDNVCFYQSLQPVLVRYIEAYQSIICLTENGFISCAMNLWRSFFEDSIIINFILEHGGEVAEAYLQNLKETEAGHIKGGSYNWALVAGCFSNEEDVTFKMIYDRTSIRWNLIKLGEMYNKLTSRLINGSSPGTYMEFNDEATPVTLTIPLLYETMRKFSGIFDDKEIKKYMKRWDSLLKRYCQAVSESKESREIRMVQQ